MNPSLPAQVLESYAARPCNVCSQYGTCPHREYAVEEAIIEARERQHLRRPISIERKQKSA